MLFFGRKAVRRAILEDPAPLRKILANRKFAAAFGRELPGARVKTAPRDVPRDHPDLDLLRLTSFEVFRIIPDREVLAKDFPRQAVGHFETMNPFVDYLNAALDRRALPSS